MQELEESLGDRKRNSGAAPKKNRKTEYKNQKFGFGGKKKNLKKNTAESSADVSNKKSNKWQRPSFHAQKGKKVIGHVEVVDFLLSQLFVHRVNENKLDLAKILVKKDEQKNNSHCYCCCFFPLN